VLSFHRASSASFRQGVLTGAGGVQPSERSTPEQPAGRDSEADKALSARRRRHKAVHWAPQVCPVDASTDSQLILPTDNGCRSSPRPALTRAPTRARATVCRGTLGVSICRPMSSFSLWHHHR
jgi:hypothetical protein